MLNRIQNLIWCKLRACLGFQALTVLSLQNDKSPRHFLKPPAGGRFHKAWSSGALYKFMVFKLK